MALRRSVGIPATLLVLLAGAWSLSLGTQPSSEVDYGSAVWVGGRDGIARLSASDGTATIEIDDAGSIRSLAGFDTLNWPTLIF